MKQVLSLVIPVYNEGASIRVNCRKVSALLEEHSIPHQFVLVDDGSRDQTWPELQALALEMPNIKSIKLSRNFGKEAALCAGLDHVETEGCLCMDADLQHPPEMIPEMYRLWNEEKYQVVEGIKQSRGKESLSYKIFAKLFYRLLQSSSGIDLNNASDFRLMDRSALDAWKSLPEKQTFFRGMSTWIGFRRIQVPFHVAERTEGESKWSLIHLAKLALNAITAYSAAPLYLSAILGGLFILVFCILLVHSLYMKFTGNALEGFTTVIALQLIIGGVLMLGVGIIGIYLEKIYEEVKARPRYLVQAIAKQGKSA